jgi:hypothetical protein
MDLMAAIRLFGMTLPIHFALLETETEIRKIKDDSKIDREKNIHRCSPRQFDTFLTLPTFWLPTTFKGPVGRCPDFDL